MIKFLGHFCPTWPYFRFWGALAENFEEHQFKIPVTSACINAKIYRRKNPMIINSAESLQEMTMTMTLRRKCLSRRSQEPLKVVIITTTVAFAVFQLFDLCYLQNSVCVTKIKRSKFEIYSHEDFSLFLRTSTFSSWHIRSWATLMPQTMKKTKGWNSS